MKIVVIEDEVRIREGLSRLIQKIDQTYEVVGTAQNGQDGLELCRRLRPDVVVTDIKMPLMDGLEMLKALYGSGFRGKAVVLSAYSEFEYARQAMRLGVKEYLLKPIVVGDIVQSLQNVRQELHREDVQDRLTITCLEEVFSGILWGSLKADKGMAELLEEQYGIDRDTCYTEFVLYLGSSYETDKETAHREARRLLSLAGKLSWKELEAEEEKMLVFILYGFSSSHEIERLVQQEMLCRTGRKPFQGAAWNPDLSLGELREGFARIKGCLEWNVALGDDVLISCPKIAGLVTSPCIYPIETEGRMKVHLCANEGRRLKEDVEEFEKFFRKGNLYAPREMKECYVRFLWAMINVAKETGMLDPVQLDQQELLEQIMEAKTRQELGNALHGLRERITNRAGSEEAVHLTVKRAQSLIKEFYQSGITLEEIAAKLDITPEYLGTKFHKELGVNFSTYIKNVRVAKAKELLIGTPLKLYEIAERVGYSDPKYFSRVFREATGQLPADYRKAHK